MRKAVIVKRYDTCLFFTKYGRKRKTDFTENNYFFGTLVSDDNILITIPIARVDVRVNWASD